MKKLNKKKIVHVLAYYGDYPGGIQVNVRELAKRQLAAGHEVKIITSDLYGSQKSIDGITITRVKAYFSAFRVPFTPSLPFILLNEKCDILHVHLPLPWLDLCSVLKKRLHRNTKLIVTVHNYIPVNSLASKLLGWVNNKILMPLVFSVADIVTVSTKEFKNSLPYVIPENKLAIIPMGVDIDRFKAKKIYDKNQILFVGRLIPEKGLHILMDAMKLVRQTNKEIKLTAICGQSYDYKNYEKKIRSMDSGFLKIIKNVPNDKIAKYYANSACLVMPSLDIDSFGIVLLEAMACGCPIVVSDLPGPSSIAVRGNGIVVPKGDSIKLAKAIFTILKKSASDRKNVRLMVEKNYSWEQVYKLTKQAYSL